MSSKDLVVEFGRSLSDELRPTNGPEAAALDAALDVLEGTNELVGWMDALGMVVDHVADVLGEAQEAVIYLILWRKWPRLLAIMETLGIVEVLQTMPAPPLWLPWEFTIHWERIGALFNDPEAFRTTTWDSQRLAQLAAAIAMAPRSLRAVTGNQVRWAPRGPFDTSDGDPAWVAFRQASEPWVAFNIPLSDDAGPSPIDHVQARDRELPDRDFTVAFRTAPEGFLETWLLPAPEGERWLHEVTGFLGTWNIEMAPAIPVGFADTPEGWRSFSPDGLAPPARISVGPPEPTQAPDDPGQYDLRLGPPDINLTIGDLGAELIIAGDSPRLTFQLRAQRVSVTVSPRALGRSMVLRQGMQFDLDFELVYTSTDGVGMGLTSASEVVFDIDRKDGGGSTIPRVRLVLEVEASEEALRARLRAHLTIVLVYDGLMLVVDGLGAWAGYWPPSDDFLQRLYYGILPPYGMGLSFSSDDVRVGGYLNWEGSEENRYSGVVHIAVSGVDFSAFAQYEEFEDGTASLAVVGGVTFSPGVPLFWGLTLEGVGLILGLHRRIDADAMRARMVTGSLSGLLFAEDPIKHAPRILDDLEAMFPAARNVQTLGLALRVSYSLAKFDLGLVFEFATGPNVYGKGGLAKVVLFGGFRARHEQAGDGAGGSFDVRGDFLGIWDLHEQLISYDASLRDSRFLAFDIFGDQALRVGYAPGREFFLVSIGGVHPAFNPAPVVLPKLERAGLGIEFSNDFATVAVSVKLYLALSSTALQFGAEFRVDLTLVSVLGVSFWVAFDLLMQWDPFSFRASISGGIDISLFGFLDLVKGFIRGEITGPKPTTRLSLTIGYSFMFGLIKDEASAVCHLTQPDYTAGDPPLETSLLDVAEAELARSSNLAGSEVTDLETIVETTAAPADGRALISPLGRLRWAQTRIPLDTLCDRLNGQALAERQAVRVEPVGLGVHAALRETFSPAAYTTLDRGRALDGPGFERLAAGLEIASGDDTSPPIHTRVIGVHTEILDIDLPDIVDMSVDAPPLRVGKSAAARLASGGVELPSDVDPIRVQAPAWSVVAEGQAQSASSVTHAKQVAHTTGGIAVPTNSIIQVNGF